MGTGPSATRSEHATRPRWATRAGRRILPALVAAVPALAAVVFWRPGYDVFLTVKATVMVLGAGAIAAVALVALARAGRVIAPPAPVSAALAAYCGALGLATAAAERPLLAVAGRAGRHVGLATALAAVMLLLGAAAAFRRARPTPLIVAALAAAVPVAGYALVQAAGADPFDWRLVEGGPPVFSTLGNANFLSAWLGMVAPLAAWGAVAGPWGPWPRAACGALGALVLVTAAVTASAQGVVAGTVGVAIAVGGWIVAERRRGRAAVGALVAVVALAVAAVAAAPGDVMGRAARSLEGRLVHWETAWRMAADHPWRGVGLAGYRGWSRAYESAEASAARGLERAADSPHSVPLDLLASGGWPLLLTWLAVVAAVAWTAASAWRVAGPARRTLLAGLVGGWAAYLVAGLVSIDVAPVAALGWALAGAIVGTAGRGRVLEVPPRAARPAAAGLLLSLSPLAIAAVAPLRADLAAADGLASEAAGQPAAAEAELASAAGLAPWEPRYPALRGALLNRHGERQAALDAYEEAHRRDPRAVTPLLNIARLAVALGDEERARQAYEQALRRAPNVPEIRAEAQRDR